MARPNCIELFREKPIPILYEDRSILAMDKPPGWMLVPLSWQKTNRNLQAAIFSSIGAGHFWARSRGLTFLKYIHRLDTNTTGILLFAKSQGALDSMADLFESRQVEKIYLAVTDTPPPEAAWTCRLSLAPDPNQFGRILVDQHGREAETSFRVVASAGGKHLIEARPRTGRQHQIRVHLAAAGCPIIADELYGRAAPAPPSLRAVGLAYPDPFTRRPVGIRAPVAEFLPAHGFAADGYRVEFQSLPVRAAKSDRTEDRTAKANPPPSRRR